MIGLNVKVKIILVKVFDFIGYGDIEQIVFGIKYVVDKGVKVINLSLGGGYSCVFEFVLKYVVDKNVLIVVVSGNDGVNFLFYFVFFKYVMLVGVMNCMDMIVDFFNYGKGLDIFVSGFDILSLVLNGNVMYMSGIFMVMLYVVVVVGLLFV